MCLVLPHSMHPLKLSLTSLVSKQCRHILGLFGIVKQACLMPVTRLPKQIDPGATPGWAAGETPAVAATPSAKARSRWDETPAIGSAGLGAATPMMGGATPGWGGATPAFGVTPMGGSGMETPTPGHLPQVCCAASH